MKRKDLKNRKRKKKIRNELKEGAAFCLPVRNGSSLRGSLTLEAALSLTLFLFLVVLLAMPMELLNTQRQIQMVLEVSARELSRQAGIFYQEQQQEDSADGMLEEGIEILLASRIRNAVGTKKIEGLNCSRTQISGDGEWIDLRAEYRLRLPFAVFTLDSIPFSARSRKRGWIGRTGGEWIGEQPDVADVTMVYVGKGSVRYHLSPECHYLSNEISAVSLEQAKRLKNKSGSSYKACHVCGGEVSSGSEVYLFPNGAYYHSRKDCSSVRAYIKKVPLKEAEHLGACSYCGGKQ